MSRKESILNTAVAIATVKGFRNVRRVDVSDALGISPGLIHYHYISMDLLHDQIVARAVSDENAIVVGQALAERHPAAMEASTQLKQRARKLLGA